MRFLPSNKESPLELIDDVRITRQLRSPNRHNINQYTLCKRLKEIGGSHVEISVCRDGPGGREVLVKAVKRKTPEDKYKQLRRSYQAGTYLGEQAARKEITILQASRHPNIVRLFEVVDDETQDKVYLGNTRIYEWRTHSVEECRWSTDTHGKPVKKDFSGRPARFRVSQGIIHRDLKPANLVWSQDHSVVKIIDFGISHFSELEKMTSSPPSKSRHLLRASTSLFPSEDLLKQRGTCQFMAPEVAWIPPDDYVASSETLGSSSTVQAYTQIPHERPPITKAIDVWSLGVILYCFLFGGFPFQIPDDLSGNNHHNRFVLFKRICTLDWTPADFMGADSMPTGGRKGSDTVIALLDSMLQKNPRNRISVKDAKRHAWVLDDIARPEEWIRMTTPNAPDVSSRSWMSRLSRRLTVTNPCRNISWNLVLHLADVSAPRMGSSTRDDEPWAFESREFLRAFAVGKEISFVSAHSLPSNDDIPRDLGSGDVGGVDLASEILKNGWGKVKESKREPTEEDTARRELESEAKAAGKGIWNPHGPKARNYH
ncbi:transcription factor [Moniliophthora roreri]|uniref:Protein kinase domain-containing protein n=1 Tax=Moniliophthora roreri TaxID=221103 RepID=A0A0W0FHJ3_MONRR|nr:transcription factor [Moniliophthora roreri]